MPPAFKSLATIMAWVLWLVALVIGFSAFITGAIHGDLFGSETTPTSYALFWAVAGFYGIASVVVMILRKKME